MYFASMQGEREIAHLSKERKLLIFYGSSCLVTVEIAGLVVWRAGSL